MPSNLLKLSLLGGLVPTLGCGTPFSTRPPGVAYSPTQVQKRMLEYHDPFADQSVGPAMHTRPRDFSVQRTAPRRAAESRMLQGFPARPGSPGVRLPQQPPIGGDYPGVVRE